jgi:predicted secreted protein
MVCLIALVLTTAGVAAACSGDEGGATNSTNPGTTIGVDGDVAPGALDFPAYSDPNTPIYMPLARRFALKLTSDPGAGYSWQVSNQPDRAVVIPLGTQLRSDSPGVPGASAQQYISFATSGEGTTKIDLHYVSPDGQVAADPAPISFSVTVTLDGTPPPPPPEPGTTVATR